MTRRKVAAVLLFVGLAGPAVAAERAVVQAQEAIRVQPAASMMGQAAGTAAAQAIAHDETADKLNTERLDAGLLMWDIRRSLESGSFLNEGLSLVQRYDPDGMAARWLWTGSTRRSATASSSAAR